MTIFESIENGFRVRGPDDEVELLIKAVRQAAKNLKIELEVNEDERRIKMPSNEFLSRRLLDETKRILAARKV